MATKLKWKVFAVFVFVGPAELRNMLSTAAAMRPHESANRQDLRCAAKPTGPRRAPILLTLRKQ